MAGPSKALPAVVFLVLSALVLITILAIDNLDRSKAGVSRPVAAPDEPSALHQPAVRRRPPGPRRRIEEPPSHPQTTDLEADAKIEEPDRAPPPRSQGGRGMLP